VREPSVEEARQVYAVRTLLEGAMLRELAGRITEAQIARLRQHLADEPPPSPAPT
jgi:DNA-binding GntR family transcriptional regulator